MTKVLIKMGVTGHCKSYLSRYNFFDD